MALHYQTEEERKITQAENLRKQKKKRTLISVFSGIAVLLAAAAVLVFVVIIPSNKYAEAVKAVEAQEYQKAFELFRDLGNYKDSAERKDEINLIALKQTFKNAKPGDEILFGEYEQDNEPENGKEPVEWMVLDVQGDRALLLTKYCIEGAPFNRNYIGKIWEECTLRQFLNNEFMTETFSDVEQSLIPTVTLDNVIVENDQRVNGTPTDDRVFLLSIDDLEKYFPDVTTRQTDATKLAKKHYAYANAKYYYTTWWWLRDAGYTNWEAAVVFNDGLVMYNIQDQYTIFVGVRPAVWVDFSD